MKELIALFAVAVLLLIAGIALMYRGYECAENGGVFVRSISGYECLGVRRE